MFITALATNQNDLEEALNLLSTLNEKYATTRFLRLTIYTKGNYFKEAFKVIISILNFDKFCEAQRKSTIGKELVKKPQSQS